MSAGFTRHGYIWAAVAALPLGCPAGSVSLRLKCRYVCQKQPVSASGMRFARRGSGISSAQVSILRIYPPHHSVSHSNYL